MQLKNYIVFLLVVVVSYIGVSQERQIAYADDHFKKYEFIDAQRIYLKVADKGYHSADLLKKLGDSYYFNAELNAASRWYGVLYKEYRSEMEAEYLFRYAQSLKSAGNYSDSDIIMDLFETKTGLRERRAQLFNQERDYLDLIEMQSGKFQITDVGINSSFSDFAPSFHKDELVFASSRGNSSINKVIHEWNEMPFLDLYTAVASSSTVGGDLQGLEKVKGKVNTKFHESSSVFTKDGNTMYFTRNNYTNKYLKQNEEGTTLLKLYRSRLEKGKWSKAEELPFNSDSYSVAHPALSADDKKLYFASDMPGGKGLSDLYVVDIRGDDFGIPKSLGDQINTEGRETFPFISESGRLYFASDGHIGLGGLDVFVAIPTMNSFEKPLNIGAPVNSPDDDFTFILKEDTKMGYFASNRPGGLGDDDIYSFIQIEKLITRCKQTVVGQITDANTRAIIKNATVSLLDKNSKEITSVAVDDSGNYTFNIACKEEYIVRAAHPDYKSTEIQFFTDNTFEKENVKPLQLNKGQELQPKTGIKVGDDLAKILQLEPIYFDLDKSFIRPDAEIELQKVIAAFQEYPTIKIDVRSHTDSRSSDDYNMHLSERRAKSTIKYIIEKGGVSASRISGRGYGETSLVNQCGNTSTCSEEEHQKNRRSEFIILQL